MTYASVIHRVLVVLALVPLLTSCERTYRWQEEVQLSDGAALKVSRLVSYRSSSGALRRPSGRRALEERLSFADPGTGRDVEWHESRGPCSGWTALAPRFGLSPGSPRPAKVGMATFRSGKRTCSVMSSGVQWTWQMYLVPVRNLLTTDYPVTKQLRYVSLSDKRQLNAPYPQDAIDWAGKYGC